MADKKQKEKVTRKHITVPKVLWDTVEEYAITNDLPMRYVITRCLREWIDKNCVKIDDVDHTEIAFPVTDANKETLSMSEEYYYDMGPYDLGDLTKEQVNDHENQLKIERCKRYEKIFNDAVEAGMYVNEDDQKYLLRDNYKYWVNTRRYNWIYPLTSKD